MLKYLNYKNIKKFFMGLPNKSTNKSFTFSDVNQILTYDGKTIPSNKALNTVDGEWCHIDDPDLIEINGHRVLKTSQNFVLDYTKNDKVHLLLTDRKLNQGIVDIKYDNSSIEFVIGYFSDNLYFMADVFDHTVKSVRPCINVELLNPAFFDFSIKKGVYYSKSAEKLLNDYVMNVDYKRKGYSIEENEKEFNDKIKLYADYKPTINKNIRSFTKLLGKDLSFGLETETCSGHLPDHIQYRTGTVICRDGSLAIPGTDIIGAEYVTVPMKGVKGVANIQYLMTELQKFCKLDLKCSMHIHFGGISTDRAYLLALYNLCFQIQNDIFKMFPYYKTNPEGVKGKNYNQKITNLFKHVEFFDYKNYINTCYKRLFHFLSGGIYPNNKFNRKDKHHPSGSKWNITSRYYWVNFNNAIFSKRNTIEFRLHTPTLNYMKTIIWLYICNAILRFAEKHQTELINNKSFSLKNVFDYYSDKSETGKFVSEYLYAYYEHKKKLFEEDFKKGDIISMWDIDKDHIFDFTYQGIGYWF